MADKTFDIAIKVKATSEDSALALVQKQLGNVSAKLKDTSKASDGMKDSFGGLGNTVKGMVAGFTALAIINKVAEWIKKGAAEALEMQRQVNALTVMINQFDKGMGNTSDELEKFIGNMKQVGMIDDQILSGLRTLIPITQNYSRAVNASKLAWDISIATGRDYAEVVDTLAGLIANRPRALKQSMMLLGEESKSTQEALDKLFEKFGGYAEKINDDTTAFNRFKELWNDFWEDGPGTYVEQTAASVVRLGLAIHDVFYGMPGSVSPASQALMDNIEVSKGTIVNLETMQSKFPQYSKEWNRYEKEINATRKRLDEFRTSLKALGEGPTANKKESVLDIFTSERVESARKDISNMTAYLEDLRLAQATTTKKGTTDWKNYQKEIDVVTKKLEHLQETLNPSKNKKEGKPKEKPKGISDYERAMAQEYTDRDIARAKFLQDTLEIIESKITDNKKKELDERYRATAETIRAAIRLEELLQKNIRRMGIQELKAYKAELKQELLALKQNEKAKEQVKKKEVEIDKMMNKEMAVAYSELGADIMNSLSTIFGENKAFAIASTILSTYAAAQKQFDAYSAYPPLAYTAAAAAVLQGLARVKQIQETKIGSAEGGYAIPRGLNPVVQTHQEEHILPAKIAKTYERMAEMGMGETTNNNYGGNRHITVNALTGHAGAMAALKTLHKEEKRYNNLRVK
jgi:hypothetical protein